MPVFSLKWSEDDPSNSIILCFANSWLQPILNGEFAVVFRKSWPKIRDPKMMFAYVGSPTCEIVARMPLIKWSAESLESALNAVSTGCLTEKELRDYVGDKDQVFVIQIGPIEVASRTIPLSILSEQYGYCPSPAAAAFSGRGEQVLNGLAQFRALKVR